jgi:hypothetical protein
MSALCAHSLTTYQITLLCQSISPKHSILSYGPEQPPFRDTGCIRPSINRTFCPLGDWYSTHVAGLPDQIHYGPTILSSLNFLTMQVNHFRASQTTCEKKGEHGGISLPSKYLRRYCAYEVTSLFDSQPVTDPLSDLANAFHPANRGSHIRARIPWSTASYASLLTAANLTLMVAAASCFLSKKVRYCRTTERLNASRAAEQYQLMNSVSACSYERRDWKDSRVFRTAFFACSNSGRTGVKGETVCRFRAFMIAASKPHPTANALPFVRKAMRQPSEGVK